MREDYAVVYFIEKEEFSEVSSNWLANVDETKGKCLCKWPPDYVKNVNFFLKKRYPPGDDWTVSEIKFIEYSETLGKARHAAADADLKFSDEFSQLKQLPPVAEAEKRTWEYLDVADTNNAKKLRTVDETSSQSEIKEEHPVLDPSITENETLSVNYPEEGLSLENPYETSDNTNSMFVINAVEECDRRLKTLEENTTTALGLLRQLLGEIRSLKHSQNAFGFVNLNDEYSEKIKSMLPLNTAEEVTEFQNLLTQPEYLPYYVRIIHQTGGCNGKEFTERALAATFSNLFAKENTWEGKKNKYCVKKLPLILKIQELILEKYPMWSSAEFEKAGVNWFRLGSQRAGTQPSQLRKEKRLSNPSESDFKLCNYLPL